jgi:hypothetical protein
MLCFSYANIACISLNVRGHISLVYLFATIFLDLLSRQSNGAGREGTITRMHPSLLEQSCESDSLIIGRSPLCAIVRPLLSNFVWPEFTYQIHQDRPCACNRDPGP